MGVSCRMSWVCVCVAEYALSGEMVCPAQVIVRTYRPTAPGGSSSVRITVPPPEAHCDHGRVTDKLEAMRRSSPLVEYLFYDLVSRCCVAPIYRP